MLEEGYQEGRCLGKIFKNKQDFSMWTMGLQEEGRTKVGLYLSWSLGTIALLLSLFLSDIKHTHAYTLSYIL